eukprot:1160217-Pelagomonas_calceolata.AAC.4
MAFCSQAWRVAGGSLAALPAALHNTTDQLSPLWVADYLVAVITWMLLYLVRTFNRILATVQEIKGKMCVAQHPGF